MFVANLAKCFGVPSERHNACAVPTELRLNWRIQCYKYDVPNGTKSFQPVSYKVAGFLRLLI